MAMGKAILNALRKELNLSDYRKKHWEGTLDEYLDTVREHPEATRKLLLDFRGGSTSGPGETSGPEE